MQIDIPHHLKKKLAAARYALFSSAPFYATMLYKLDLVVLDDETGKNFRTAFTDGKVVAFNREFLENLDIKDIVFIAAHEVMHVAFMHFVRRQNRHAQYWNMATDYAINALLKRDNVGKFPEKIKVGDDYITGLYDKRFENMSAEQIYDILIEEKPPIQMTIDQHVDVQQDKNGQSEKSSVPSKGEGKDDGTYVSKKSKEEIDEIAERIKENIIASAQACKMAGKLPDFVERMLDEWLKPKISWKTVLRNTITSKIIYDTSFSRPNKRSWDSSFIIPGPLPDETINVGIAFDTSGSMTNEQLKEALSEVRSIMEEYQQFRVLLWSFDTKCDGLKEFTHDNAYEIDEYRMVGGGGTHIAANWEFIKNKNLDIEMLVVFTDLYDSSQNSVDPSQIETLWIINGGSKEIPPFGNHVYYDDT